MRGATVISLRISSGAYNFNPRTPCGVRLDPAHFDGLTAEFQSTHPMRGATRGDRVGERGGAISIHAPHAGCDACNCVAASGWSCDFNPRTPCGVRQTCRATTALHADFNPRTPCGVRPERSALSMTMLAISIHAPHAGCDLEKHPIESGGITISIHAPHAGCDQSAVSNGFNAIFQSTHPMRGATRACAVRRRHADDFNPRTPCGVRLIVQRVK